MGRRHTHDRQAPSLGARCLGAPDRIICHVARRIEPLQPFDEAPIELQLAHFLFTVLVHVRGGCPLRGAGRAGPERRPPR
jgi:hypothetical protein